MPNCITGSLEAYNGAWGRKQIQHLYNRLGNGASLEDISAALTQSPGDVVDALIDEAMNIPVPDENLFPWAFQSPINPTTAEGEPAHYPNHVQKYYQMTYDFAGGLAKSPVHYKMTLFWHNHFVTETPEVGMASITYLFLYYRLLHEFSFGNFKTFTQKMGLNPYMLLYLNGRDNRAAKPNENYARELMELFTMGEGNYSENDVKEIARGLTGWKATTSLYHIADGNYAVQTDDTFFEVNDHDWNSISLFESGDFFLPTAQTKAEAFREYEWIHDTIFSTKRQVVARFICRKLYKYYVYHEPSEAIVNEMATTFMAEDQPEEERWQIHTVLRQLFKSQHFFNPEAYGASIKSPLELFASFYKQTGLIYNTHWFNVSYGLDENFDPAHPFNYTQIPESNTENHAARYRSNASTLGQNIFLPPSVAGWPGGRTWINEFTMVNRWDLLKEHIDSYLTHTSVLSAVKNRYRELIQDFSNLVGSTDTADVTLAIIDHYMTVRPDEEYINYAISTLEGDIPLNYLADGTWIYELDFAETQFPELLKYLLQLPAFQLN